MLYSKKNSTAQIYCQRVFILMIIMTIGFRPQTQKSQTTMSTLLSFLPQTRKLE